MGLVDHPGVVEGTKADVAGAEGPLQGDHDRLAHVIEVNLDRAVGAFAFETNLVPNARTPVHAFGGFFGNFDTRRIFDDEDVVGVVIGGCGNVRIIKA